MADKSITDKEWLDIAWKHFQQHAQQRILYFNYFVVFSTILSTGLITTFQNNFHAPYLGIGIGIIQIFLSFIFWKIDDRNKFLTQHAENLIKEFEKVYNTYRLFSDEAINTMELKRAEKNKFVLFRQISHGKSYRIILMTFLVWGVIGVLISSLSTINNSNSKIEITNVVTSLKSDQHRIDSISKILRNQEEKLNIYHNDNKMILSKLDSINNLIKKIDKKR